MTGLTEPDVRSMPDQQETLARRRVGRPRRLTLEGIVDTACQIGLARLEMASLAERLNTGVATLYSYVRGRDHLLQLVTERLAGTAQLDDRGQTWPELLREHATISSAVFAARPQLISNLLNGVRDGQTHDYSRKLLEMLVARGFSPEEAADLYIEVTQLVIGAAICAERRRALGGVSIARDGAVVALPATLGDHRATLERLIRDVERGRPH